MIEKLDYVNTYFRCVDEDIYHWYDDMTVIIVIEGKIRLRVRAKDNIMESGDILVLNPGEIHKITTMSKSNLVGMISFDSEFCIEVCCDFRESIILCNSSRYKSNNMELYNNFQSMVIELIKDYGAISLDYSYKEKTKKVVCFMCYHFDFISSGRNHKRFSEYIIARNKMLYREIFLDKGTLSEMNLKEISKKIGLSYGFLRVDIIERFGHGFNWLKYTLMTERAARIILSSNRRLIDISNQCGFSDQKYLRKYINIFYQCNPSELRKQNEYKAKAIQNVPMSFSKIIDNYNVFQS